MKRTLLEILGGLTALALLIFFSHEVASLKIQNRDLYQIRELVQRTVAKAGTQEEVLEMRREVLERMDKRLRELEERLVVASRDTQKALKLKAEIEAARQDVDRITADFLSTVDLVNGYVDESRSKDKKAEASIFQTKKQVADLTRQLTLNSGELTRSMLAPTVQLNGQDTVGSGTLVFSGENLETGKIESYVLTSYHVVRNILADTPRSRKADGIDVTIYLENKKIPVKGEMIAHSKHIDAALVKLRTNEIFPNVARVLPKSLRDKVRIWEPVIAVGCPLGNDPVPTQGTIGSLDNKLNGSNYWMINAPTYFGNSGGGVYLANSRQLIGVFSKIYTHGKGNPVVIPHMGLCTPIGLVQDWLADEKLDHLLVSNAPIAASPAPGK